MAIDASTKLEADRACAHLGGQLIRSGTSPALNYAEALGAESRKDFIHKIKIVLKELRETYVCLRILVEAGYFPKENVIHSECNQLISIFVKSLATAKRNSVNQK